MSWPGSSPRPPLRCALASETQLYPGPQLPSVCLSVAPLLPAGRGPTSGRQSGKGWKRLEGGTGLHPGSVRTLLVNSLE